MLVATDAWHPQVNGVVRTYERLALEAPKLGFEVSFLAPPLFRTLPCPTYPEIRLALAGPRAIAATNGRIPASAAARSARASRSAGSARSRSAAIPTEPWHHICGNAGGPTG